MILRKACLRFLLLFLGLAGAAQVGANQIAVLVHGYLGDGGSWHRSGVVEQLERLGWRASGHWRSTRTGVVLDAATGNRPSARQFYTVALPSTAPLMHQASILGGMLQAITNQHPDARIELVGHSAGGVVARLALVNYGAGRVTRLTTIAAPHLGTERAWQALDVADDSGVFGKVKRWFVKRKVGDELYRTVQQSRGALADLGPPVPGSLLYWLNGQTHPDIAYTAIVRSAGFGMPGDRIVPAPSQDMNRIPALRGRAQTFVVASDHLLRPDDGLLLARILSNRAERQQNSEAPRRNENNFKHQF